MSSIFDKIKKRAAYPFKMVNGETVYLRSLTIGQLRELEPFKHDDAANGFAIGCCLLNDDLTPAFTRESGQSAEDFGRSVSQQLDLPFDVFHPLVEMIFKLSNEPSEKASEAIVKN